MIVCQAEQVVRFKRRSISKYEFIPWNGKLGWGTQVVMKTWMSPRVPFRSLLFSFRCRLCSFQTVEGFQTNQEQEVNQMLMRKSTCRMCVSKCVLKKKIHDSKGDREQQVVKKKSWNIQWCALRAFKAFSAGLNMIKSADLHLLENVCFFVS